jgi:glycolate oxidase FAD binding subunit
VDAPVLETTALRGWEHEPGDFTAVVGAGLPVSDLQARVAEFGQMLAVDPPGDGTVGGLFATGDSGPLRHRYGAPRDLIIGVEMALSDGTVANGGGRVIKNVAGYDLPKLATGSYGTLGVITEVCVRLHPLPTGHATAVIRSDSPDILQAEAVSLGRRPLEAEALDVRWDGTEGAILVRFAGSAAADRAAAVSHEVVEDDSGIWEEQRARQRGDFVVRVHHLPTQLADVLRAAPEAVGRAGIGTTWVRGAQIAAIATLSAPAVVLDAPAERRRADPFALGARPERALMRRVKERFDPPDHCNPGLMTCL